MTQKEFRLFVKDKFRQLGFQSHKSINYRFVDEDYIVCMELYASSYCKGYKCSCGSIFLPNEEKYPLCGRYDAREVFKFPRNPADELDLSLSMMEQHMRYDTICEYSKFSLEQVNQYFDLNIQYFLVPMLDREYTLDIYRKEWRHFQYTRPENIVNICQKAGLNPQEVFSFIGKKHIDSICRRSGRNTEDVLAKLGIIL